MASSLKKRLTTLAIVAVTAIASVAPSSLADDYSYVKADHLNVRSIDSVKGKIVATVDKGYRMTVLESASRGWKKVLLENGQEGYVNGKYLAEEAPYYERVTSTRYAVKVGHAFIRSDGLLKKIAVVDSGDQLEAVSDRVFFGRWIRVSVVSSNNSNYVGRVGYINKKLVEPVDGFQFADEAPAMEEAAPAEEAPMEEEAPAEEAASEEVPEELNSAPAEETETDSGSDDLSKLLEGL